jgi:hypothetical protein
MLGRSLMMKASGARLLYPTYVQGYLDRVTAADVAAGNTLGLERGVTDAFNTCLQAMVADTSLGVSGGVLAQAASLIKASCAMQGARTLSGALVPLAADMPAPTNFNFVTADYNRRMGLVGNGTTKYLNTNRAGNADPRDDVHFSVYATERNKIISTNQFLMGTVVFTAGASQLIDRDADSGQRIRSAAFASGGPTISVPTFFGASRFSSTQYTRRINGLSLTIDQASDGALADNTLVFTTTTTARLNFYSTGRALDLAFLDARITALSNAIQAAIAP